MIVERFKAEHLENLVLQPAQEYARANIAAKGYGESLAKFDAFSAIVDGRVVACAGVVPVWDGRGDAWALIAADIGPGGMHDLHFAVKRYLRQSTLRRTRPPKPCGPALYRESASSSPPPS